jgi:RNA polymerase sigma factor (sigma-70 family)
MGTVFDPPFLGTTATPYSSITHIPFAHEPLSHSDFKPFRMSDRHRGVTGTESPQDGTRKAPPVKDSADQQVPRDEEETAIASLIEQAQGGDERAYGDLYQKTVPRIYALCLRMCGDGQHAEELTQDVFVKAWSGLSRFRGDSRFSTWLHRVAVNVVLEDRRTMARRGKREVLTDSMERYDKAAVEAMPGTRVDLERAIASLPDGAREVLLLRDVQGYKYREVASMLGVAVGTVKAQVHRARKMVQQRLE